MISSSIAVEFKAPVSTHLKNESECPHLIFVQVCVCVLRHTCSHHKVIRAVSHPVFITAESKSHPCSLSYVCFVQTFCFTSKLFSLTGIPHVAFC